MAGLRFVPNQGQWHRDVRYAVLGPTSAWLHDDGFTVRFSRHANRGSARELQRRGLPRASGAVVRTRFSGAAENSTPAQRVPGVVHYLRGDEARWRTDVPAYDGVTMARVQPGIDVVYRAVGAGGAANGRGEDVDRYAFAYDLALAPGADLGAFTATCEGADALRIDGCGRLCVAATTPEGPIELTQDRPIAWQETPQGRRPIEVEFELLGERTYGFTARELDPLLPTIVDPGVAWSTYIGGGSSDSVNDLVWRPGLGIWLTGWAASTDFPTTVGAYQTTGQRDAFVARLDENGNALHFATYFGGSTFDEARGIDLGPGLTPVIVGLTDSVDLPVTPNAYQSTYGGASLVVPLGDGFLARLSAAGDSLLASTYLGGALDDVAEAVVVDAQGHSHVAGWASSGDFPTTPGSWQPAIGGPLTLQSDGFLARLAPDVQTASYCTYVGGTLTEQFLDIALDAATGEVVTVGWSISANFPTTSLAYRTTSSGSLDMVIVRLAASGAGPVFSSFLGGVNDDMANCVALAGDGSVWLGGWTDSSNFPVSPNAVQSTSGGEEDGVVCKLAADGQSLPYSTRLGGSDGDQVRGLAVDGTDVLAVGEAGVGFPLTLDAIQPTFGGGIFDGFVTHLSNDGATLSYSSYVGGAAQDVLGSVAYASGLGVLGGWSFASDFPVTAGALQTQLLGAEDGVVMMLDFLVDLPGGLSVGPVVPPERRLVDAGESEVLTAELTNTSSRELSIEAVRVLVAGRGFAPTQVRTLSIYLDDPAIAGELDRLVGGPIGIQADDVEVEVTLDDVRLAAGADMTLRAVADFVADTTAGTVELACAIVDSGAWTLRAFGAGGGPMVRVLGSGRVEGPVLVAGALPGDADGDGRFTVLDLRNMCTRLGSNDKLVDADGDQTITLADVGLTCDAVLEQPSVFFVPPLAPRGSWIAIQGVFPASATVDAVLGGQSLTVGCLTARELTLFVEPGQASGTQSLTVNVGGRTVVAQSVLVP